MSAATLIRLARVELTRLLWRRAVVVLLALVFLLPAAVFGLRVHETRTVTLDQILDEQGAYVLEEIDRCERRPRQFGVTPRGDVRAACEAQVTRWYGNNPLDLVEEREDGGALAAVVLITMLMLLIGTTFAGHDWNTGSISNQMLFESRRGAVWAAKALAVGLLSAAAALAVLAAYWTGMWVVSSLRDLTIAPNALEAGYKQAVLGAALAATAALVGYALTMLLRSTVGTLGTLFALSFLCIVVVAGVLGQPGDVEPFMPWGNFYAYLVGTYEYYDYDACAIGGLEGGYDGDCTDQRLITRGPAAVYFAVLTLVVMVPSVLTFRRRDLP